MARELHGHYVGIRGPPVARGAKSLRALRMNKMARKIVALEGAGFGILVAILWLNELFDVPHVLFGAQPTPINWVESLLETAVILPLCAMVVVLSWWFLKRIKHLEGLLPICASCRKIRSGRQWTSIETYVRDHSEADFTHGMCPDCLREHYGEDAVQDH